MRISIASDHGGFELKKSLVSFLKNSGFDITDLGTDSTEPIDYPIFAEKVALSVAGKNSDFGILICTTGIGMAIASNKIPGIRAALACDVERASSARRHNDANILCLGAKFVSKDDAEKIASAFLNTDFEGNLSNGERHARRICQISSLDEKYRKF